VKEAHGPSAPISLAFSLGRVRTKERLPASTSSVLLTREQMSAGRVPGPGSDIGNFVERPGSGRFGSKALLLSSLLDAFDEECTVSGKTRCFTFIPPRQAANP
jgi:hypothetical protein